MSQFLDQLARYVTLDEVIIDSLAFQVIHKGCSLLLLMGSMVGLVSQYFGQPISCDFKGVDRDMASDYCWIHGSSYIPPQYQPHMRCIVDLDGVESLDDAPDTSYYQWVTFMLLFQACTFMLLHYLWTWLEGGLVAALTRDLRLPILLRDEVRAKGLAGSRGSAIDLDAAADKYWVYFKSIMHHNNWYFAKFVVCELSSILLLFTNFFLTNLFLGGRFYYYGWNVAKFWMLSKAEQRSVVNPMCEVFPTEVSCTVPNVGAAGGEQSHNGLCVLAQNIINEKMYLVLWFWFVLLIMLSGPYILFRLSTFFFPTVRFLLLLTQTGCLNDPELTRATRHVCHQAYLGDWFVLCQIAKNVNPYFLRNFLKDLGNNWPTTANKHMASRRQCEPPI